MTDIAMCPSKTCPSRKTCRRNPASGTKPTPDWQAWSDFDFVRGFGERCAHYMANALEGAEESAAEETLS